MQVYRIEHPDYWDRTTEEVVVALTEEELRQRFSITEIKEFYKDGFRLYEYYLDDANETRGECIVTKDDITNRTEVSYKKIWSD